MALTQSMRNRLSSGPKISSASRRSLRWSSTVGVSRRRSSQSSFAIFSSFASCSQLCTCETMLNELSDRSREAHMFDEGGEDFIDGEYFVCILHSCQMTDEE